MAAGHVIHRLPGSGRAVAAALAAALCLVVAPPARADVFNGRIAFSSDRADPPAGVERAFDIFSMNADGTGVRRLTTNPELDRQSDWSPDGRDLAYSIRKPNATINFEVARMTAAGTGHRQLTTTATGQASSQPAWRPDGKGILFRRSGPGRLVGSIWQMGLLGEAPGLRFQPPHNPLYPSWSPDMRRVSFAAILSPTGDSDRGIFTIEADGSGLKMLFDVAGAYDSAPAWSPDGRRIAFESDADVDGANPERDTEIWTMAADGTDRVQLTHNTAHDEGPAWRPDGKVLAYTSGPDDTHGDIHLMTAAGRHLGRLTSYAGPDESPDWQAIPAPHTARRCGGLVATGPGARDVRAIGPGLRCSQARSLARRWVGAARPARVQGYRADVVDFGGVRRVVLSRGEGPRRRLVAFLYQPG
jgi:TolB protein